MLTVEFTPAELRLVYLLLCHCPDLPNEDSTLLTAWEKVNLVLWTLRPPAE